LRAVDSSMPADVAQAENQIAQAAIKFWNSLTPAEQGRAGFAFADAERMNWHYTPVQRKGLPWKDMTAAQRNLGEALLHSALSEMGYNKAAAIEQQQDILKAIENGARAGSGDRRDPNDYYLTFFGKPDLKGTWAWRFEGHHVAFNFTMVDGALDVATAPNFFGSNPAKVPAGFPQAGLRVLAAEEDLGRKLITALDESQRKTAIMSETAPREIITGEQQRPDPLKPTGIPAAQLTQAQKTMLMDLIREYAGRVRAELAQQDLKKIEQAGVDKIYFAWAGSIEVGGPHYYRVQGPTFLIEYDDTQNDANHIHAVWRDATNDFGADLLKIHYQLEAH
jgi:hypothetical protein